MGNGFVAWFSRSYKGIIVTLVAIMAVALSVLAIQHVNSPVSAAGTTPRPIPTFDSTPRVTNFAVVGDSVTAANSPDIAVARTGDASWTQYANADGAHLVGGWAQGGATTAAMDAAVTPYDADVLVILAGTNDSSQGVPFATSAEHLKSIASKAGINRVVISSIPPQDAEPAVSVRYNEQLAALAEEQGWTYVDAAAALRGGNSYREGFTVDGIHPTVDGAKALGEALHKVIVS